MATVKEIVNKKGTEIFSVPPDATISEALKVLAEQNIGVVLVMKDDKLEGIFSERDFVRFTVREGSDLSVQVKEVMTKRVYYIESKETVERCMAQMSDKHVRHLPVFENDKLVGVISINDVVRSLIADYKDQIQGLENFIMESEIRL